MDNLPAWFLRLGAHVFCEPLAYLFNKSLAKSVVPRQWKQASIRPVPKTATPLNHSDYKPISITSVLSRTLERIVVREFLYPAILDPLMPLSFGDQFAFRPMGLTMAALIALMQTIMPIQLLPNSQKIPMKLCLAGSDETDIMFSTGFILNPTAINIICALDGITFHYQLKQMIGTL